MDLPEQGHNMPSSQQSEKITYIIRTGFDDKFKAEMKEEFNKISKLDLFMFSLNKKQDVPPPLSATRGL